MSRALYKKRFTHIILLLRPISYIFALPRNFGLNVLHSFENIAKTLSVTLEVSLSICVYYLPPEVNENGGISQEFYDYLTNIIFRIDDNGFCVFMGDMNARCGNEEDIVTIIDKDIPDRVSIDDTKNSRGTVFLDFLKSVNYCMLIGRITPDLENFTCISHKGRSVVDYLFVRHESISNINQFSVLTVTDLCQSLNIQAVRAMPDHSIF